MKILCALGLHKLTCDAVYNHEGEFSHYDRRCPKCGARYEQWMTRNGTMYVPRDANPLDVWKALQ